jgi:hypothetical protein
MAAFVAGGYLERKAPHWLGSCSILLMHMVDWYATLIGIRTSQVIDDKHQESKDVPLVDSLSV